MTDSEKIKQEILLPMELGSNFICMSKPFIAADIWDWMDGNKYQRKISMRFQ